MAEEARTAEPAPPVAPPACRIAKTSSRHCRVRGEGLTHAVCGEPAFFMIEAFDEDGKRRSLLQSEHFFVAIRARGTRGRAKVTSFGDGEYEVRFLPNVSGSYSIAISLLGESLVGSPFRCQVTTVKRAA